MYLKSRRVAILAAAIVLVIPTVATSRPIAPITVVVDAPRGLSGDAPFEKAKKGVMAFVDAFGSSGGFHNSFAMCFETRPGCAHGDVHVSVVFGTPKTDAQGTLYPVRMIAYYFNDARPPANVSFSVNLDGNPAFAPTDDLLQTLLGTPVLTNGELQLAAYSPYLQLVPTSPTDRKYMQTIRDAFGRRHVPTIPSLYTGIDDSGVPTGGAPIAAICANSPSYFVYSVRTVNYPRPLAGQTRVEYTASGSVVDCANTSNPPTVTYEDHFSIPTSKSPIASAINLLSLLWIRKTDAWTSIGNVGATASTFVDVDPTSSNVEQHTYDLAIFGLVDTYCYRVKDLADRTTEALSKPMSGPVAVVTPKPKRTPRPAFPFLDTVQAVTTAGESGTSGSTGPATTPLAVGGIVSSTAPVFRCDGEPFTVRRQETAPTPILPK